MARECLEQGDGASEYRQEEQNERKQLRFENVLTDDSEILSQSVAHKYATYIDQDAESLVGHL